MISTVAIHAPDAAYGADPDRLLTQIITARSGADPRF
jgi:hypothetical protein